LQQSLRHLATAYKNFFDSRKGKRKGVKIGLPKFKKKTNNQSAEFAKNAFSIAGEYVYLGKIGNIKPVWSRQLPSVPSSVTVIKDCAHRYFVSFVVDIESQQIEPKNLAVGIDLGLKTFAVLLEGEQVKSPNYSKLDRRLRKRQRQLARQQKDSNRSQKTRIRVAKLHNQIADKHQDFLHKLSTKIVSENQIIVWEDLNVSGLIKNPLLSRAISWQGWYLFLVFCEAKSDKFGRESRVISRWGPTSQLCSECGFKWGKLALSIRELICMNCGTHHDRDANAAKNIKKVGMGYRHDSLTGAESE
jgi:putative transposase